MHLGRAVSGLLSPGLGSLICGVVQVSTKEKENVTPVFGSSKPTLLLLHRELDGIVGRNGVRKGKGSSHGGRLASPSRVWTSYTSDRRL